ncbi:MAG: hypothetical protein IKG52_11200 [Rhodobacteraceae bacterium]|nr:hypothetical protein [Paracoccaceae bacterium]
MDFDFETLNNAVGLARDVGTATGNIARAIQTVQGLFQKSPVGTDADIKLALSDLTLQVANAQMANAHLKGQLLALQQELGKAKAFKSDLEKYVRQETQAGSIVYAFNDMDAVMRGEPLHYLCASCIEDGHKSILQGDKYFRKCPKCKTEFGFEPWGG